MPNNLPASLASVGLRPPSAREAINRNLNHKKPPRTNRLETYHNKWAEKVDSGNRSIFLLSIKSGLRSKEISKLKWKHILDHEGEFMDSIHLTNDLSKGKNGGRMIPINSRLRSSLMDLLKKKQNEGEWRVSLLEEPIITTQRNRRTHTSPQTITNFFHHLYRNMGLVGYGSHSGRRTFITRTSRKINEVGGSMKDIQYLSGHSSLQTTQRYIEHDPESHKKIIEII